MGGVSQRTFDDLSEHPALAGVAALEYASWSGDGAAAEGLAVARATDNLPALLGVQPAYGRWFQQEDTSALVPPVVVGWDLWTSRFESDTSILGQLTDLEGARCIVVGVMPARFDFPLGTNVWMALPRSSGASAETRRSLIVLARLGPGHRPDRIFPDTGDLGAVSAAAHFDPKGLPFS